MLDVLLQAVAGQVRQPTEMAAAYTGRWSSIKHGIEPVFCACESDQSQVLTIRCPGAPTSPQLRVDNMDDVGIEVAWEMPDETAEEDISVQLSFCFWILEFYLPWIDQLFFVNFKLLKTVEKLRHEFTAVSLKCG